MITGYGFDMTRLFRHSITAFARLVLGLMLFTQLSHVAQACAIAEVSAASAVGSARMSGSHGMHDTANRTACLPHCLQDAQADQGDRLSVVPLTMDTYPAGPLHMTLPELPRASPQRDFSAPLNFAERPRYLRFGHFLN